MHPIEKKKSTAPLPIFALSPPLSSIDCEEVEASAQRADGALPNDRPRSPARSRRRHRPRTHSSPSSLDSDDSKFSNHRLSRSFGSAVSSQPSDHKQEEGGDSDVERAFTLIKTSWLGLPLPSDIHCLDYCVLHITPSQYKNLCRWLGDEHGSLLNFFNNTLRSDYDPRSSRLVLRLMESAVHEFVKVAVSRPVWVGLDRTIAGADAELAALASRILGAGNARIQLDDSGEVPEYKSPDSQICFEGTLVPPFVIEIGYSQTSSDLRQRAKDYYEDSAGEIKTVLTLKVAHASREKRLAAADGKASVDRTAFYCLYRGPERICKDVVFRNSEGRLVSGEPVRLLLSDLVPDEVLEAVDPEVRRRAEVSAIGIPLQQLCRAVEVGERHQVLMDTKWRDQQAGIGQPSRKRKTVHVSWEVDSDSGEDQGHGERSDSDGQNKRRKPGSWFDQDRAYTGRAGGQSADFVRRTRSKSRGESQTE